MFNCQQCLMLPLVILEGHAHTLSQLKKNQLTFGCMKIVAILRTMQYIPERLKGKLMAKPDVFKKCLSF